MKKRNLVNFNMKNKFMILKIIIQKNKYQKYIYINKIQSLHDLHHDMYSLWCEFIAIIKEKH